MTKLVRDRIPEIAPHKSFYKASPEEYYPLLQEKLREEVEEFLAAPSLEEMADIIEVLRAFCDVLQMSFRKAEQTRKQKFLAKGAFQERWTLGEK